jgi:hypothetical protein
VRPVEQAHDAFDEQKVGVRFGEDAGEVPGRMAQGSRLQQGRLAISWKRGSM